MDIRPIHNDREHALALAEIDGLWGAADGSPEADRLEVLVTLVNAYEAEHHPIEPPDPIDAIRFRMEQQGLTRKDLEPFIGGRARVSEVLSAQSSPEVLDPQLLDPSFEVGSINVVCLHRNDTLRVPYLSFGAAAQ